MIRSSIFAFSLIFVVAQAASAQEWARKMFKVTSHDFGAVARGSKAEFDFELKNIYKEDIPIVPLYFAAERPVIERDGMLMLVDDDRLKLFPGEKVQTRRVRFRTLGCYPLTGAIESDADTLPKILLELLEARTSERQGRAIDTDSAGSMEKKKQEGYF